MQLLAVRLAVPAAWQRDDEASNCSTVDASACLGDAERMMRLCPASCLGLAAPDNSSSHSCQLWAQRDECIKNGGYMKDASILRRARNVESARGSAGKRRGRAQPAGALHKLVCVDSGRQARCSRRVGLLSLVAQCVTGIYVPTSINEPTHSLYPLLWWKHP